MMINADALRRKNEQWCSAAVEHSGKSRCLLTGCKKKLACVKKDSKTLWYISGLFGVKLGYIELCVYVCSDYNLQCKRCPNAVSLVLNTGKCKHLIFHMSSTSLITFLIKCKGDRRWRGESRELE